jgi:hypothetical protein
MATFLFNGYHLKSDDLFIIGPIEELFIKIPEGSLTVRQMVLPVYSKFHTQSYPLTILKQQWSNEPSAEQMEEWNVAWEHRQMVYEKMVADWKASL